MASGPEHYREAETNLDAAARASDRGRSEDAAFWLRSAQVHATLAVAAATALNDAQDGTTAADWDAWRDAASAHKANVTVEVPA